MEHGEQAVSAAVEAPEVEERPGEEDVTMEVAMAAIAVSGDDLRAENDDNESANGETASVASDGTVDLEQMELEEEQEQNVIVEESAAVEPEVAMAPALTLTADEKDEETPAVESAASAAATDANTTNTNDAKSTNSSGSSSSSDSDSSSSSDSDSSDSDVEDVTDQFKQAETSQVPPLLTMSEAGDDEDDEADAEQWFEGAQPTLEADGVEVVGVVDAPPQDDDDEEEDIFLTPFRPDPKLERGSATKRQRPRDETMGQESAGEETTSSEPEPTSDGEWDSARRRKKSTTPRKKAKAEKSRTADHKAKGSPPVVYTEVPSKYDIFHNVPSDDSNFPFLKGEYEIRGGHRAVFTGYWGFTEADFQREMVSKFEYSSGYLHNRRDGDMQPFSGIYGGYFNLRQFSGKISKIKEDRIELHFVALPESDETKKMDADDGGNGDEDAGTTTQYEVFGEGKNLYGRFLVRGYFSAISGRMTVRRRYLE